MTNITERYASAVHSRHLKSDWKTSRSDSDVLGAMGLADRTLSTGRDAQGNTMRPSPLAVPLARLLHGGDNRAAYELAQIMGQQAYEQSWRLRIRISPVECRTLAEATLGWFRQGACKVCGGHGYTLIPGTVTLSHNECQPCRGTGKLVLERQFKEEHRPLVTWLVAEMERALAAAGPMAMQYLAPRFELDRPEKT